MRLDLIQQQFRALGLEQKDIARRVFDQLASESRTFTTVETKLSKLFSATDEGRRAFAQPALLTALAVSLGVSESQVAEWFAGEALLLDPTLPLNLSATLRRQVAGANVEVVEVQTPNGTTPRDALRTAADAREDAIIALATEDDAAFYEGRGRRYSLVQHRHRLGAILTNFPELVPSLPPEPPSAWDGRDPARGIPRVVHPDFEAAIDRGDVELSDNRLLTVLRSQLSEQRSNNQIPSFLLNDMHLWLARRAGTEFAFLVGTSWQKEPRYGLLRVETDPATENTTDVWVHERRLHLRGPGSARLAPWLRPHEVVFADPAIDKFREALRTRNPFSDGLFKELIAEGRNAGVELAPWLQTQTARFIAAATDAIVIASSEEQELAARDLLRGLCAREWRIPRVPSHERGTPSTVPLWLRRAVSSPLLLLAPGSCDHHVVASIGAGRLLHILVSRFSGSAPTALTVGKHLEVDGGDIHMWLRTDYDEMLEGDSLVPRRRRDAAAETYNDDDDD